MLDWRVVLVMDRCDVSGRFSRGLIYGVGVDDVQGTKECRSIFGGEVKSYVYVKSFSVWRNMLKRCYHKSGCYKGKVTVDDRWHKFSVFKKWFDDNYIDGWELDKDLIGDSSVYSEEACVFLPKVLNRFLMGINKHSSGVWWDKSRMKYQSYTKGFRSGRINLGRYDTFVQAKTAWVDAKQAELEKLFTEVYVPEPIKVAVFAKLESVRGSLKACRTVGLG